MICDTFPAVAPMRRTGIGGAPFLLFLAVTWWPVPVAAQDGDAEATEPAESSTTEPTPWDYDPYRVLLWIASDDPSIDAESIGRPLRNYLRRDFDALWRMEIDDAPASIASLMARRMTDLEFDDIAATDPVIAVKRDHPNAIRIKFAYDVGKMVKRVVSTRTRIDDVLSRSTDGGDLRGVGRILSATDGDSSSLRQRWADPATEALLVSRGIATELNEPEAKIIVPPIDGLVARAIEDYDKVFLVRVRRGSLRYEIAATELDTLMQHFSGVAEATADGPLMLADAIGQAVTDAFAPVIRIDNAGRDSVTGTLRAAGLIRDEDSPGLIHLDDVLQPLVRKNDRNGRPISIGPLDWAYLVTTERDGVRYKLDFYSGRAGGLQGRQNKRTFRMALKVRPFHPRSTLRLHAKGDSDRPLIGYEIYQRELGSKAMTFVGRTNWDGRMAIEKTEDPMRLLYVKNGGAVLARLPLVPGHEAINVADIAGDDMRLQAEAYIRGTQNRIIDLIAKRQLLEARIRARLEQGKLGEAETLMQELREQPTNESISNEMGAKQTMFLKAIGRNVNQARKVDELFSVTREMLAKHVNDRQIRELENDLIAAKRDAETAGENPGNP